MSNENSLVNRIVWTDTPVADLTRAIDFYSAVLGIPVHREKFNDFEFAVLDHQNGSGGCLVVEPDNIAANVGILVYFNVSGRIRDAVAQVEKKGGSIIEDVHPIGPHGFRALVKDSEGNTIALHSPSDA
jgi:predicted enzyme related to lactoylglutathione lyase